MENYFKDRWVLVSCKSGTAVGRVAELDHHARTAVLHDCHYITTDTGLVQKDKAKGVVIARSCELSLTGPDKYVKKVHTPLETVFITDIWSMTICTEAAVKAWTHRPFAVIA